jgi:CDP-paratose 2-epimerase
MAENMREKLGISVRIPFEEYERLDSTYQQLNLLNVRHVRIGISWADVVQVTGWHWVEHVLKKFADAGCAILACISQTPPHLTRTGKVNGPPESGDVYADFVDQFCMEFGGFIQAIEHWHAPNNPRNWDDSVDPDWNRFAVMVQRGALAASASGVRSVLGGVQYSSALAWVSRMDALEVLEYFDAVSFHAYPGMGSLVNGSSWYQPEPWTTWHDAITSLAERANGLPVICTETGFATWDVRKRTPGLYLKQVEALDQLVGIPLDNVYWHSLFDEPSRKREEPFALHLGLIERDHSRKAAYYRFKGLMHNRTS